MPQRKVSALACLLTVIKAGSLGQKCPASPLRTIYGAGRLSETFVPSVSPWDNHPNKLAAAGTL